MDCASTPSIVGCGSCAAARPAEMRTTPTVDVGVFWRELVSMSAVGATLSEASLLRAVLHVVLCRPKPKMVGPDAASVVTRVADVHAGRWFSKVQLPRDAVRVGKRLHALSCIERESPIAAACGGGRPQPAAVCLVNLLPESLREGLRDSQRAALRRANELTVVPLGRSQFIAALHAVSRSSFKDAHFSNYSPGCAR